MEPATPDPLDPAPGRARARRPLFAAGAVLLLTLGMTGFVWLRVSTEEAHDRRAAFEFRVRDAEARIDARMQDYEEVLRGAASLFASSRSVQRSDFHTYVAGLELEEHFPGIQGLGFSLLVPASELDRHVEAVRAEGFPGFSVRPPGERDPYTSIVYLEPFAGRNLRAFGYDMFSEPTRREAMVRARDDGRPTLSGKVTLVQETDNSVQAGVLLYLPIYSNRAEAPRTPAERRERLVGWVYMPFRMGDLMAGTLGERAADLAIEIYDGTEPAPDSLLFASAGGDRARPADADRLVARKVLPMPGRDWTLVVQAEPSLLSGTPPSVKGLAAFGGAGLAILLSIVVWLLASGRDRAERLARQMNRELLLAHGALRTTVDLLERTGEMARVGGWVVDLRTMKQQWTRQAFRILDLEPPDAPSVEEGMRLFPPGSRPAMEAAFRTAIEHGTPYDLELQAVTAKGRPIWVRAQGFAELEDGKATRLVGAIQDVTDRKRIDEALQESQGFLTAVVQSSSDLIWSVDPNDFGLVTFNRGLERQFHLHRSIVLKRGDRPEDLFPPGDHAETWRSMYRRALREGPYRVDCTFPVGSLTLDLHFAPIRREGKLLGIAVFGRDVTEQRRVEAQLRQSQKLESIGRLAGGVAHDFNNLLTVILSAADEMRDELGAGRGVAPECVEEVRAAGRRAAALTRQLLTFARKQVAVPEVIDLGEAVHASRKLLGRVIGEDIRIEEHHAPGLWRARCDPDLIGQLVMNLVLNARDAMPAGGALTLSTDNVAFQADEDLPAPDLVPGAYVRLSVRDTGQGMAPEVMEHLFEPFFTTKAPGKGTGLGLSTVYGIVKESGASVAVRSAPGEGTTFEVYFPRHREESTPEDVAPAPPR